MRERRKLERSHLIHYLRIFDRNTRLSVGNLVDITPEGIMFICESAVEPDTAMELRMEFPEEVSGKRLLVFDAHVMWCRPDINNPALFAAGLLIDRIEEDDRKIILELIADYKDSEEYTG